MSQPAALRPSVVPKPRLRGRLHQIAFFLSIPQGIGLVVLAAGWMARVAAGIYALSLAGLYGVSAAYHRMRWSPRALLRMRRLDHSMIFVLIAGTYTPFSLLVLDGAWSVALLATVWAGALAGIAMKIAGLERTRKLTGALYIVLGWLAVIAAPKIVPKVGLTVMLLIVAGGLMYTIGSIVFALRRPDPRPLVFGYHEVWHVFVFAASACHYAAMFVLIGGR